MVLILDGNSEQVAHACKENSSVLKKKNRVVTDIYLNRSRSDNRVRPLQVTCAPISELLSMSYNCHDY